jgi:hypothetical protein
MNTFAWKCVAVSALALVATGCGPGGPRLYKAGGTVTRKSVPVQGAQVTFAYDDGNFANGVTDAAGKFELAYMNRPGGAAPGKCKVSVTKKAAVTTGAPPPVLDATPKSEAEQKSKMAAMQQQMEEFARKQAERDAGGGASGDFTKTGLVYEITTDESKNNFVIDIPD